MFKYFILALSATQQIFCVENEGDDPLDWLRNSIPGEPGVDYPILASVQDSSFTCDGLTFGGYYADVEQQCQAYHICLRDPVTPETLYPVSFLCPNGTIFNQEIFVCDWWFNVDCAASEGLYGAAEGAFGNDGGYAGGDDVGECPAPGNLSPEECAGAVSNCWSPGQRDTDCPNNGLCCFDGCADTCVDGPKPPPVTPAPPAPTTPYNPPPPPPVQPVEAESESQPEEVGYSYPTPEVPLEFPKPKPPPPELPTLYGAPPI